jgi:acetoin utilization deacetylase AcuC-like enzyme
MVLSSLGVDTFKDDPICNFNLTSGCYSRIGEVIRTLGVPTLFVLEGYVLLLQFGQTNWESTVSGYDLPTIGLNVVNMLRGFLSSK